MHKVFIIIAHLFIYYYQMVPVAYLFPSITIEVDLNLESLPNSC